MNNDESATLQMKQLEARARWAGPTWYYDQDGDCIEFVSKPDRFYGERVDAWVTAYYSCKTGELVGSQVKGIKALLEKWPGLQEIEVSDGGVQLSHIYRATGWTCTHAHTKFAGVYNQLIKTAEEANAAVAF